LDIMTYHRYQENGKHQDLPEKVLQPDFLWKPDAYSREVQPAYDYGVKEVWIGEGAMASNSGRQNVTDVFMSSLWFANALGCMAKAQPLPISTFCRQTLVGGHYEIVDHMTLDPNPDFYLMRLWKHVVGTHTIGPVEAALENPETLRIHAFCGKTSGEVVLIFINIDENDAHVTLPMGTSRDVYTLRGFPDVRGKEVQLNGELQSMGDDGSLPEMTPNVEAPEQDMPVPFMSVVFAVLHGSSITACDPPSKELPDTLPSLEASLDSSSIDWGPLLVLLAGIVATAVSFYTLKKGRRKIARRRHTALAQEELHSDIDEQGGEMGTSGGFV
jgi:heparanase 1